MTFVCAKRCSALFNRTLDSLNLLQGLCQRDESLRHEELSTVKRTFDSWYYGFGSPAVAGFLESVASDTGGATCDTSMHGLIREQIPDLVRISFTGPSSDIRDSVKNIILDLRVKKGFRIPQITSLLPSSMKSLQKMEHMRCLAEEPSEDEPYYTTYMLFREYWFQWGRLENYICVMGYHPEYLECFMKLQAHLFHADLPIPYPDRHYLAVLAAAELRCIYLVLLFARYFLAAGGDPVWLQGIQHAPVKWRQLLSLNRDLAERPWVIKADRVYSLTHRGDSFSRETLSLSELMHAVAIMTHVHALTCFIFACGIVPEIDQNEEVFRQLDCLQSNGESDIMVLSSACIYSDSGTTPRNGLVDSSNSVDSANCYSGRRTSVIRNSDTGDQELSATQLLRLIQTEDSSWEEVSEDIVAEQFMEVTQLNIKLDAERSAAELQRTDEFVHSIDQHPAILHFVENSDSGYINFQGKPFHVSTIVRESPRIPSARLISQEYSWQEEGYALADRLCSDLGSLLDEKFRNAHDLTYNTLNFITNVDTSLYRRTVWNHVQSLFGICHDDFRYDRVDRLLTNNQRAYLKLCATEPVAINPQDHPFDKMVPALSSSEVVHVILMVVEARQQACLLYALRAISECQACDH
ncbi:Sestrin [Fasciola gigantica]|uniref:Sestrin n=1 Tax=Fasciola gigantica TaxID=46835 RepID=A0A504Z1Q4_FASGI|nr:Sestrin [Fasciola gigantica]